MSNENIDVSFRDIYRLGYLELSVPKTVLDIIQDEITTMDKTKFEGYVPYNNNLAGSIQHEYVLRKSYDVLNELVSKVSPFYWRGQGDWNEHIAVKKHAIRVNPNGDPDLWVNFQQPGEVNPMHTHGGALSFVIWIQLPFTMEDEFNHPSVKNSNFKTAAQFRFHYADASIRGGIGDYFINADHTFEGKMIIFPADLVHSVAPFRTSNKYRISVSGNIAYE